MNQTRHGLAAPRRLEGWRVAICAALLLSVLEGALRKWALPNAGAFLYFAKDGLLLLGYAIFPWRRYDTTKPVPHGIQLWIFLLAVLVIIEAFNPRLPSFMVGVFGARAYLINIPLIFVVPRLFPTSAHLRSFIALCSSLLIPITLLSIVQFNSPLNSVFNTYAQDAEIISSFGNDLRARVTGPFPHPGLLGSFLISISPLLLANVGLVQKAFAKYLLIAAIIGCLMTSVMTGSRAVVLIQVVFIVGFSLRMFLSSGEFARRSRWVLALAVGVGGYLIFMKSTEATDAFVQRATEEREESFWWRVFQGIPEFSIIYEQAGAFGYGSGIAHPAIENVGHVLGVYRGIDGSLPPLVEAENNRILVELGLFGMVIWYGLRFSLLVLCLRMARRTRDIYLRNFAWLLFTLHVVLLPLNVGFNHIQSLYYWFSVGLLLAIPILDRQATFPPIKRSARSWRSNRRANAALVSA